MKKEIKGFVLGVLTTVVVGSGAAIAAGQFVSIDVVPNNVKINVNGEDTNISSFTYNDSTYVQLRPVLENMDGNVTYDGTSQRVFAANRWQEGDPTVYLNSGAVYDTVIDRTSLPAYVDVDILMDLGLLYEPDLSNQNRTFTFYLPTFN